MDRAYGSQALTYDDSFHPTLAADYVKWANLEPGQNVLDMACGTGLVTLAAKQAVGPTGTVVGIDITPRMLAEARRKAQAAHEDITFLRADVTDLARLPAPITTKFDVITCACAFVLLTDRVETLRQWATYLKPQGRIILDIATETSRLTGQVLAMATRELGIDVRWSSTPAEIQETLVKVVARAALVPVRVFASPAYKVVEYDERGGRERLTRALERQFPEWLAVPEMEAKAEEIFRREFRKREVGGRVREDVWFMVGIVRMKERS
ncbi:hypothetical protein MMC13_006014 [Lambiella insularis]|nr:hypothetical protein [Lambiella insularis]